MWGIVSSLINTFVLIRDFFAYLVPGAVLVAATAVTGWPQAFVKQQHANLDFLPKPEWLKLIAVLAACYIAGQLLVAFGYWVISLFVKEDQAIPAEPIYRRYRYPSMYIEVERRSIIADFRFGLGIALVLSATLLLVSQHLSLAIGCLVLGIFMLWVAHTARVHLNALRTATNEAAQLAIYAKIPPERSPKPKADDDKPA